MILSENNKIKIRAALPKKLKWGIAGCSSFADTVFLPSLQFVKRSKLVAVYSHDINRAKQFAHRYGAQYSFDDFDEFLRKDFYALYVSSINSDHYWQVLKAAKAGKHILCEKPPALNSEQIKEIIKTCKENNVQLIINHMHRFHPHVIKVKELLEKQILGKLVSISTSYHLNRTPDNSFRFKKSMGGGALRDLGSQMIDLLRYLGGNISEVKPYLDNIVYKSEVEDFAGAIVKFEKTGYGLFNASYNSKKSFIKADIVGYNGCICIEIYLDKKNIISKLIIDLNGEGKKVFRRKINKITFVIRSVQRSFLRNQPALVTGEDGLVNMNIIEEIEKQCISTKN